MLRSFWSLHTEEGLLKVAMATAALVVVQEGTIKSLTLETFENGKWPYLDLTGTCIYSIHNI